MKKRLFFYLSLMVSACDIEAVSLSEASMGDSMQGNSSLLVSESADSHSSREASQAPSSRNYFVNGLNIRLAPCFKPPIKRRVVVHPKRCPQSDCYRPLLRYNQSFLDLEHNKTYRGIVTIERVDY